MLMMIVNDGEAKAKGHPLCTARVSGNFTFGALDLGGTRRWPEDGEGIHIHIHIHIHIYIYIERERCIHVYIYIYMHRTDLAVTGGA